MWIAICNTDLKTYNMRQWHHSLEQNVMRVSSVSEKHSFFFCLLLNIILEIVECFLHIENQRKKKHFVFQNFGKKYLQINCKHSLAQSWPIDLKRFLLRFCACERDVYWNEIRNIRSTIELSTEHAHAHTLTHCRQFCDDFMCIGNTFILPAEPCMRKQNI